MVFPANLFSWYRHLFRFLPEYELFVGVYPQKGLNSALKFIDGNQKVLREMQKKGLMECLGRGPGALWQKKGITPKRG